MQTYKIKVAKARETAQQIRDELFAFPEVLEVYFMGEADSLVVVSRGRPRPGDWLNALRAVGLCASSPADMQPAQPSVAVSPYGLGAARPDGAPDQAQPFALRSD